MGGSPMGKNTKLFPNGENTELFPNGELLNNSPMGKKQNKKILHEMNHESHITVLA